MRLTTIALLMLAAALLLTLLAFTSGAPAVAAPPLNGDFADAIVIAEPLPFSDARSTSEATSEVGEPTTPCDNVNTVWYRFTPSSDVSLIANTVGSDYDTVLAVYTGSGLDSLTLVDCNDDISFPGNPQSEISFSATGGATYHFQVGGFGGQTGNLVFNLMLTLDGDGDGVPDISDNCPSDLNPGQENTDDDLGAAGATINGIAIGDALGDACDDDDDDDGYDDVDEAGLGTAADDNCTNSSGPGPNTDAYPSDMNSNDSVAINDVTGPFAPHFGAQQGVDPTGTNPGDYNPRVDLNQNGAIAINDITGPFAPDFGNSCA